MNKIRFLVLLLLLIPVKSFAQTEQAYTPPPMFGSPVVTPQPAPPPQPTSAPIPQQPAQPPAATATHNPTPIIPTANIPQNSPSPVTAVPIQPPYAQAQPQPQPQHQPQSQPIQLQPETMAPKSAPAVIAPTPAPVSSNVPIEPTKPPVQKEIPPQSQPAPAKSVPTKSASAEALLNHPVTTAPSPNAIDPLMASQIAKSKMPKPKDGEVVDDTGVDPSKVRYPNQKTPAPTMKPAKPIVEDTSKKSEKPKTKSKNITTEQQKMPVVTTKNVEELSLAPMPNVKVSSTKEKLPSAVTASASTATSSSKSSSKQILAFVAGSSDLTPAHKSSLAAIVTGLKTKPSARAQISSYATPTNATGSTSARRVALTRGLAIRTYLLSQGIDGGRVEVKALGDETGGKGKLDQADIVIME